MSPVSLHLQYFGPYRDEMVDFTKFSTTPLFLISGKTGSGKTTIFDGMCYALFDQTSGVDREAKSMRSDFATPEDRTRVTFTFTHRDKTYELVREPQQLLKKQRGEGLTEAKASVTLTVYRGTEEVNQITKATPVRDFLQDLLQMDGDQFAQIVLLPQGQFRRFLIAPSEDKATVLEQLFHTEIFSRWTDQLKLKLKQNQTANRASAQELERLQSELKWQPDKQNRAAELVEKHQTAEVIDLMTTQQQAMQAADQKIVTELAETKTQVNQLLRQDEQEKQLLKDRVQLREQTLALTTLQEQAPAMAQLTALIADLEWVQTVQSQLAEKTSAQQALHTRKDSQNSSEKQVKAATKTFETAQDTLAASQDLQEKITTETTAIAQQEKILPVYQRVSDLTEQVTQLQTLVANARQTETDAQKLVQQNQKSQDTQEEIVNRQAQVYESDKRLTQKEAQLDAWQRQLHQIQQTDRQLKQLSTKRDNLQDQAEKATVEAAQQRNLAQDKYQEFLRSQIAVLSAKLTPGTPCPVCGSVEHPHPGVTTVTEVAETEVQALQAAADKQENQAAHLRAELASQEKQIVSLTGEQQQAITELCQAMEVSVTPISQLADLLVERQATQEKARTQIQAQLAQIKQAQEQLEVLVREATAGQETLQQAQLELRKHQSQLEKVTIELTTEQKQLPADAPTLVTFKEQNKQLQAQLQQHQATLAEMEEQVQTAKQALAVGQTRLATAKQEVAQETLRLEQATAEVAAVIAQRQKQDSQVTEQRVVEQIPLVAELPAKRLKLRSFETAKEKLTTTVHDLQGRVKDRPEPDQVATQQALHSANNHADELQDQHRQLLNQQEHNAGLAQQIQKQVARQADELKTTQELAELAGVVNGDGPNSKLGLERYVLQTYLRQILSVGNHRLRQLTNGRYQFIIDSTQASSKKRSGLEINVYDDHVGEQRSVHTLSGGESFIASLALALALGEVIQQTTGSVDVDALFIDEGFGSLDEEALMVALDSLETIEGKHRMIGIISHVSELRDQVPNQLQVVATGNGESTIHYHVAD